MGRMVSRGPRVPLVGTAGPSGVYVTNLTPTTTGCSARPRPAVAKNWGQWRGRAARRFIESLIACPLLICGQGAEVWPCATGTKSS